MPRCYSTILVKDKYGVLMRVPCGQCINCRMNKARQWSIRVMHEAKKYRHNAFVTLTYDDDHLPVDGSLVKKHLQDFFKRFRFNHKKQVRYFACGEYGDRTFRPHYHVAFFNVGFDDFKNLKPSKGGFMARSNEWPYGLVHVGDLTIDSANYVAGYVLKKQTGKQSCVYGDLGILPPFCVMSRRPGIGFDYVEENSEMLERNDFVVAKGVKYALPRYYKSKIEHAKAHFADYLQRMKDAVQAHEQKAKKWSKTYSQIVDEEEHQLKADARSRLFMKGRNNV